jgi:hypothetical protein
MQQFEGCFDDLGAPVETQDCRIAAQLGCEFVGDAR